MLMIGRRRLGREVRWECGIEGLSVRGWGALVTALLNRLFCNGNEAASSAAVICYRFVNQTYNSRLQNTFFLALRSGHP